jgi:hypothetical protein
MTPIKITKAVFKNISFYGGPCERPKLNPQQSMPNSSRVRKVLNLMKSTFSLSGALETYKIIEILRQIFVTITIDDLRK